MFSLMGNCLSSASRRRQPRKAVTLALLGVDNAGKTTASCSFSGVPIDQDVAPTIGFRNVKFTFDKYDITLYDIGGGKNIRPVWKNYFPEVYGFIFMVDASTSDRMDEARDTFRDCLEHPNVSGKSVLLLANKQDKPDSLDEVDVCELLNLESVVNSNKCPCRIDACSAVQGTGKKMDNSMKEGLRWLLTMVEKNWEELSSRVESDMKIAEEKRKVEAAARKDRVRKQREEREKKEEEERQRLGIEKKDSDEEDILNGDPFKPLDLDELQRKEEKMKQEKKKRRELEGKTIHQESQNEPVFTKSPLSPRNQSSAHDDTSEMTSDSNRVFSPRTLPSLLPPLQPLGTPFLDDSSKKETRKKKRKTPRSSRSPSLPADLPKYNATDDDDDDIVIATPRSQPVLTNSSIEKPVKGFSDIKVSTHDNFPSREMLAAGISRVVRPLDGGDGGEDEEAPKTRRVKKKKLRQLGAKQNAGRDGDIMQMTPRPVQLTSLDGADINSNGKVAPQRKKNVYVWRNGFGPTEEETTILSARSVGGGRDSDVGAASGDRLTSRVSRHSQMHSNVSLQSDQLGSKTWEKTGGSITAVADDSISFRQPNFTDDNGLVL